MADLFPLAQEPKNRWCKAVVISIGLNLVISDGLGLAVSAGLRLVVSIGL